MHSKIVALLISFTFTFSSIGCSSLTTILPTNTADKQSYEAPSITPLPTKNPETPTITPMPINNPETVPTPTSKPSKEDISVNKPTPTQLPDKEKQNKVPTNKVDKKIKEPVEKKPDKIPDKPSKVKADLKLFSEKNRTLKKGLSGNDVFQLEYVFQSLGFDISPDYLFDANTVKIAKEFQAQNELEADGYIGKKSFTAINKAIKKNDIILPEFELNITEKAPENNWIMINKTNNTLYYLKGKELIDVYPVATGRKPSYTPEGKYHVVLKLVNPAWGGGGYAKPIRGGASNNPLGKRWMGINIKGGGTYGIHGNSDESSIGTYASAGCIRMHNAEVVELYDKVKIDTPVWIGTEEKLNSYGIYFDVTTPE